MFRGSRGGVRIKRPIARHLYDRFLHKYFAHDVNFELQLLARREAALFMLSNPHFRVRHWVEMAPARDEAVSRHLAEGYLKAGLPE